MRNRGQSPLIAASACRRASPTRSREHADTKSWCKAVIDANTTAGDGIKRFLCTAPAARAFTIAGSFCIARDCAGSSVALAPSSIRTAVKHEIEWFKRIKASHYSRTTPLGTWTVAEVKQITDFEKTQCGIKFSA
jgi:hypothetical protein